MKTVAFHNLGCKVNSYEMDVMQQYLQEKGYEIVNFEQKSDIYVINTCTVTNIADRKSRQMIHKAKKLNPDGIVVAVGCYVQTAKDGIEAQEGIDLAIGNNRKKDIVEILERFLKEREQTDETADVQSAELSCLKEVLSSPENGGGILGQTGKKRNELVTLHGTTIMDVRSEDTQYEQMELKKTAEHTRAYIKIQDGCDQFCSYCVIPLARGRVRSRKPELVLREVEGLAGEGYKEIVLTGIHLSSYGLDFEGLSYNQAYRREENAREDFQVAARHLLSLIGELEKIDGITRIRLGSLEPRIVTQAFAGRLAQMKKICPHFHLSLQSGSDSVLKRMNRHYTIEEFMQGVQSLREAFDRPAITTDVITGFPGETEEEFEESRDFLARVRFFEMHVFPYSKRKGTVAATLPGQMSEREKKERSAVLLKMDEEISGAYRESFLGNSLEVLPEQTQLIEGKTYLVGHTRNYLKVAIEAGEAKTAGCVINEECRCRLTALLTNDILLAKPE